MEILNTYEVRWFWRSEREYEKIVSFFDRLEYPKEPETRIDKYLVSNNKSISFKLREGAFEAKYPTGDHFSLFNMKLDSFRKYSIIPQKMNIDTELSIEVEKDRVLLLAMDGRFRMERSSLVVKDQTYYSLNIEIDSALFSNITELTKHSPPISGLVEQVKSITTVKRCSYSEFISHYY
ncbi:hypothetical protein OO013_10200 [Mangrovivirga sp. M17]|uniref:CYTH domain-containing protein n=1 Tax=Mangrovivirga halotolerans TaxID=2993936 RepID=A0ABT3RR38_9BACT|nr:hypothetical protein [Mangrovivirga halotolerans]MCX2744239.1 hypothetical protein [Mangrovivirga halotolerans]